MVIAGWKTTYLLVEQARDDLLDVLVIPLAAGVAILTGPGQAGPTNTGPHGFTEVVYAFTSTAANNGSAARRRHAANMCSSKNC